MAMPTEELLFCNKCCSSIDSNRKKCSALGQKHFGRHVPLICKVKYIRRYTLNKLTKKRFTVKGCHILSFMN